MATNADEEADRLSLFIAGGAVIEDPTALPGLSPTIEREAIPKEGVPFDTKRTTGQKVDCALCGRHRNHFKGFVVTFVDGRRAIIGRDCGEDQLFDKGAWAEMAARSERRKQTVLYEARSAPTINAIDNLLPILNRCEDEVAVIGDLISAVFDQLPDLYSGLASAAKREGNLTRIVAQLKTVIGRDGKQHEVEDRHLKNFATLPTTFPFDGNGFSGALTKIRRGLERARLLLDQEGVSLAQQGEAFRILRTLGQDFRAIHSEAEKARGFLTERFWEGVAKWGQANHNRHGNYRVARRTVRHSDKDYLYGEVRLPAASEYSLSGFEMARSMWPRL